MIYNKQINGVSFQLVCESYSNSCAWGHIVTLYQNGVKVATEKIRYYNRTWESYQYQTAIKNVIWQMIQKVADACKNAFKVANGFKVITKQRATALQEYCNSNSEYLMYNELYKMF